ncbi:PDZ domain-containing protein [Kiritimatiellaeota bacterium B1221]|nr:PDZ domain-containing protein [Kiritimatiellaeota bacterium B1221]
MRALWLFSAFILSGLWAGEQVLPGPIQIRQVVHLLGSEAYEERSNALSQLEAWSARFPRHLLTVLAENYAEPLDLEVEFQLEKILRRLGGEVLFYQPKAFLGVNFELSFLPDGRAAIRLQNVVQGSPAEQAGLRTGDHLLEVDGTLVSDYEDSTAFALQVQRQIPLNPLRLRVLRQNKEFYVDVILAVKKDLPHNWRRRIAEEEAKIEAWLQALRPAGGNAVDEPVGDFRMD